MIVFDRKAPEEAPDLVASPYADDEIVRLAEREEGPFWVATSDRALRARLGDRPDRILGGGALVRELRDLRDPPAGGATGPNLRYN
jgi:hypothetical protein